MRSSVQFFAWRSMWASSSSALSAVACASARVNGARVAFEDVVERAAGEIVLVEREDRRAPLVGPAHRAAER